MMSADDLAGLRDNWCLFKGEDGGWCVGEIRDDAYEVSEYIRRLAEEPTIAEALAAAAVEVERRDREQAERDADYARRKADGKLTPIEQANEFTASMFAKLAFETIEKGSTITLRKVGNYEAVRVEKADDER